MVGKQLLESKSSSAETIGVYIQDVVKSDGLTFKTPPAEREQLLREGVLMADNYVEVRA